VKDEKFLAEYSRLNKGQKAAVDALLGPVAVFAGPGTGKTRVLTLRIANLIHKGVSKPEEILAITFTESGSYTMRKRLLDLIGPEASKVNIHTFHGFCNRLIKEFPLFFPRIIGSSAMTDGEEIVFLRKVLDEGDFLAVRPPKDPYNYLNALRSGMNSLKKEGVGFEEYKEIAQSHLRIAEKELAEGGFKFKKDENAANKKLSKAQKNLDLANVYESYESLKDKERRYDYADMIMEVARALEKEKSLRLEVQERFQFLLVDEHQDTNDAQNKILDLICEGQDSPNLFVVGDDMQAIYRFQGASVANFLHLKNKYPETLLLSIADNYRSHQNILDYAQSLVIENEVSRARLTSASAVPISPIKIAETKNQEDEKYWVAGEIKRLISSGVPPEEIAVLYRTNEEGRNWSKFLADFNVPVSLESASEIFSDADVVRLKRIILAAENPNDDGLMFSYLVQDFLHTDSLDVFLALGAALKEKRTLWQVVKNPEGLLDKLANKDSLLKAVELISEVIKVFESDGAQLGLREALSSTGLLSLVLSREDGLEKAEKFSTLFEEAAMVDSRGFSGRVLPEFIKRLNILEEHKATRGGARSSRPGRVRLMTAHGSKGQEFEVVFVVNCLEGVWSGKRVNASKIELLEVAGHPGVTEEGEDSGKIEDEKRLFYVATTRAKKELVFSFCSKDKDGNEKSVSQFLLDLPEGLASKIEPEFTETDKKHFIQEVLGRGFGKKEKISSLRDPAYISELLDLRGISPTHLNAFLSCKWKYFFGSLLRVPAPKEPHLVFGTAVHLALQQMYSAGRPPIEEVVNVFRKEMEKAAILPSRKKDYIAKGERIIRQYRDFVSRLPSWGLDVLLEKKMEGVLEDGTKINGNLDKVELSAEGGVVVDYKTGQPKTLNDLLGKTKNEGGPGVFRQLAFYRLLCEKQTRPEWVFAGARVEFLESLDKNEKLTSHQLPITTQEAKEVEGAVLDMAKEVRELSFWNDYQCEDEECEYCALRRAMP